MKFNEMFQSNSSYLGKDDLPTPKQTSIASVYREQIQGDHGMETKTIASFNDAGIKPLILNVTNGNTLLDAYGDDSNGWINKPLELFNDPNVSYQGKRCGGVRIRVPSAAAQPAAGPVLDYPGAIMACSNAGITKEQLVAHLTAAGHKGYNPIRDTPTVQAMIAQAKAAPAEEVGFGDPGDPGVSAGDDSIPF